MGNLYSVLKEKLNKIEVNGKENEARAAAKKADEQGFGTAKLEVSHGLIAMTKDGKVIRWRPGTILSYRVVQPSFPDQQHYQMVVDNLKTATGDWERTCGVDFQHRADLDGQPGTDPAGCLFVVFLQEAGGSVIASSFFPSDPPDRRHMLIDPTYFTTSFDKVGVLRHELGHVLGFRHEHIRNDAPPVCPNEPLWDTQVLSVYDPKSVMHYFCGGVGSHDLQITDLDRKGARMVYGPPLAASAMVE